jgi:hypothetical protein
MRSMSVLGVAVAIVLGAGAGDALAASGQPLSGRCGTFPATGQSC